jgi:hypothetical protein
MEAWDDDSVDVDTMLNKIIYGVLHHPAQRDMGPDGAREGRAILFDAVREWWDDMGEQQREDYRRKLSRDGVEAGENHREGERDCGHGCGGKLKVKKNYANAAPVTFEDKIAGAAATAIMGGVKSSFSGAMEGRQEREGGLGGFLSNVAGGFLNNLNKDDGETKTYQSGGRTDDGGYSQTTTEYGRTDDGYSQTQHTETQYGGGGGRSEYSRYEQREDHGGRGESQSYSEQRTETTYGGSGGGYGGGYGGGQEQSYGSRQEQSYGGARDDYIRGSEQSSYGGGGGGGYGQREEESRGYGGGGGGYGQRDEESRGYGGGYGNRENREDDENRGEGYGGYGSRQV